MNNDMKFAIEDVFNCFNHRHILRNYLTNLNTSQSLRIFNVIKEGTSLYTSIINSISIVMFYLKILLLQKFLYLNHQVMKTFREVDVEFHAFITWELDGDG
jgi:hypothetical protein